MHHQLGQTRVARRRLRTYSLRQEITSTWSLSQVCTYLRLFDHNFAVHFYQFTSPCVAQHTLDHMFCHRRCQWPALLRASLPLLEARPLLPLLPTWWGIPLLLSQLLLVLGLSCPHLGLLLTWIGYLVSSSHMLVLTHGQAFFFLIAILNLHLGVAYMHLPVLLSLPIPRPSEGTRFLAGRAIGEDIIFMIIYWWGVVSNRICI